MLHFGTIHSGLTIKQLCKNSIDVRKRNKRLEIRDFPTVIEGINHAI